MSRITILGSGSWGTSLALILQKKESENKNHITLWGRRPQAVEECRRAGENKKYLPGYSLAGVTLTGDLEQACQGADFVILAIPTRHLRGVLEEIRPHLPVSAILVSVSKGMEQGSFRFVTQVIEEICPAYKPVVALSGPSHAEEVAAGVPTAVVAACSDLSRAEKVQRTFMSDSFRIYTNTDILGVEAGGAVKNIIAIAAGICHGLGFGSNTLAALMTRGMVEIVRLGRVLGADPRTFYGLAGMGDLITTCVSGFSRNRSVGEKLARGMKWPEIEAGMTMVAEGVYSAKSIRAFALEKKIDMPITEAVHQVLFEGRPPREVVVELMRREPKEEGAAP